MNETDERLAELAAALSALAALDFSRAPKVVGDGTMIDGLAGCVAMLGEELEAQFAERARIQELLERRVAERSAQLAQAAKLVGIGQLAAGVAHELNNPLAVILAFAQGVERRLPDRAPELVAPVAAIVREALRCQALVEDLLKFARIGKQGRHPVNLEGLVRNAAPLLQARARAQATQLRFDVGAELPPVLGDRAQLEQVLVHLGVNALEAVRQGGHVGCSLARDVEHVLLAVSDDGPGISDEVRPRLFEPFFTTKQHGRGLGLTLSFEIVQQHGGRFDVDTAPGRGTTMTVRLPVQ